jgi:glutathione synthase/RimK-type ligase-like ATP-grasp enzyme
LWQQQIAASAGLPVPYTLVSNDPAVHAELASQEGQVLCKTFGYIELETNADLFVYSNLFGADEIAASSKSIAGCPVFAQKYVPKRYEYRTMVIGERVLTCRIDSQASDKTKVDWRHYDFDNVAHEACELPGMVNERLRMFMRAAKLKYGAIDLIETPDGEFVFLEVNPSGQWGWIAHYAGLPIPDAVAEMLANR